MMMSVPRPMPKVQPLAELIRPASDAIWARSAPGAAGSSPRIAGACDTTIWTAIPTRNPVVTGIDRRSATKPNLSAPAIVSANPTRRASAPAAEA